MPDLVQLLTDAISSLGPYAYVYYVLGYVLTALSPVIPTPLVTAIGGTAFGFWPATLFGVVGLALGAAVSLSLARWLGRPLLLLLTRRRDLGRWEEFLGVRSLRVWALLFFTVNLDVAVMASGLTSLPLWRLWLTALLARTPWVVAVAWFGSALFDTRVATVVGLAAAVVVAVLLARMVSRVRAALLDLAAHSEELPPARRRSLSSDVAQARVEDVADGVAKQVEADDREEDGEAGEDRHPGRA